MTTRNAHTLHTLLAAALTLVLAGPAMAQNDNSGNADSGSGGDGASQITEAQLQKFADAYGAVRAVRAQYAQKMRKDMLAAIKDSDLGLKEYRQISQQLKGNKELQKRLRTIAQQRAQQGQSGSQGGSGQQQ
ncbi:MAG: hypothetical protein U5K43_02400 [Halofilum sp. (in: g-proteobacteria)]|nr:hypothetical protein [Halofilum sp. (in: g-proteobacteria)]